MGLLSYFTTKGKVPAKLQERGIPTFPMNHYGNVGTLNLADATAINSEKGAMAISTAYRCMGVVANTVAMLHGDVYVNRKKNTDHIQYGLWWKKPNNEINSFQLKRQLVLNYQNIGNGFAVGIRERGVIRSWHIRKYLEPILFEGEKYFYDRAVDMIWEADDVIHLADIGTSEHLGLSRIIQYAKLLGKSQASLDYVNKMYSNNMFLGGVIQYPESITLSKEFVDERRKQIKDSYGGIDKAGELFMLDRGGQLKQFENSMPLSDAEYVMSENLTNEDICRVYGVPPFKVFQYAKMSGESMEAAKTEFAESTIMPIITMLEQEINNKAFKYERNTYIKHEIKSLLRADLKSQAEYWSKMASIGKYTINELREMDDQEPVDGGDVPLIQANNYFPLNKLMEYAEAMIAAKLSLADKLEADAHANQTSETKPPPQK